MVKFKDIDEALEWIMSQRRGTNEFSRFRRLNEAIGQPDHNFKVIHVAGTNGKGSTVTYLRDGLLALGYTVGTLQSPHYRTHLDRIRVNGDNIESDRFLAYINEGYDFFVANDLNMFEIDYLIMCRYFIEKKVDFAIVEVGMGGRLDATNVVKQPLLSIIVTIGYDHMEVLGDTLGKICLEKCGIIKDDSAVLVGDLDQDLKDIVKDTAQKRHSEYLEVKKHPSIKERCFLYRDHEYELGTYAKYQIHNAAVALEALYYLDKKGWIKMDEAKVKDAFKKTKWQGRFEIIKKEPLVILDGAHNVDGIKALIESIKDIPLTKGILFSAIKSKEYDKMLRLLKKECDEIVLTKFQAFKGLMDTDFESKELDIKIIADMMEAYRYLKDKYGCVIVCGSLYFISEFIERFDADE